VTLPIVCFAAGAPAGPSLRRLLGEERAVFILVALLAVAIALARRSQVGASLSHDPALRTLHRCAQRAYTELGEAPFADRPVLVMGLYTTSFLIGAGLAAWLTLPAKEVLGDSVRMGLAVWIGAGRARPGSVVASATG